jgi:hypothetical protein
MAHGSTCTWNSRSQIESSTSPYFDLSLSLSLAGGPLRVSEYFYFPKLLNIR